MNSTILITDNKNIDYTKNAVINNELILEETHDSDLEVFLIENIDGKQRRGNLMTISLYDDLIVRNEVKYKILKMLSK